MKINTIKDRFNKKQVVIFNVICDLHYYTHLYFMITIRFGSFSCYQQQLNGNMLLFFRIVNKMLLLYYYCN